MHRRIASIFIAVLMIITTLYGGKSMALQIHSPAFGNGGPIPALYTCDGRDINPPLRFDGVDPAAKSLVLIVDDPDAPDPDAPKMTWVHWVLYNLPPDITALPEAVYGHGLPTGTREGINSWNRTRFGGPCPPIGRHRYFFKLYALDTILTFAAIPDKDAVMRAMRGHVLQEAVLTGTYRKQ